MYPYFLYFDFNMNISHIYPLYFHHIPHELKHGKVGNLSKVFTLNGIFDNNNEVLSLLLFGSVSCMSDNKREWGFIVTWGQGSWTLSQKLLLSSLLLLLCTASLYFQSISALFLRMIDIQIVFLDCFLFNTRPHKLKEKQWCFWLEWWKVSWRTRHGMSWYQIWVGYCLLVGKGGFEILTYWLFYVIGWKSTWDCWERVHE